jgi:hypothetical protein
MKQKDISQQLGSLINQTQNMYGNQQFNDDAIPSELQEPEPIFEVDYEDEQTQATKRAMTTVKQIVGSVMPEEYQKDSMIKDKMELDATQLGMLYYQQKMNNMMMQTSMGAIAKGDLSPRMFEVYEKLSKRGSELSKQITETQNQFRKYYIDTFQDIESKNEYDERVSLAAPKQQTALENKTQEVEEESGNRFTSKGMVKSTNKNKLEYYKQKRKQEAEEAEFNEVK